MNSLDALLFVSSYFALRLLLPISLLFVLGWLRERRAAMFYQALPTE